jgi:type IV secretory pathway VirB6-like protein
MEFKVRNPIRSKILIVCKIIEQVNSFNYLGNLISYKNEMGIDKLNNYLKITGIINNVLDQRKPE